MPHPGMDFKEPFTAAINRYLLCRMGVATRTTGGSHVRMIVGNSGTLGYSRLLISTVRYRRCETFQPPVTRSRILESGPCLGPTPERVYLNGLPGVSLKPPNSVRPSGTLTVRALAVLFLSFAP